MTVPTLPYCSPNHIAMLNVQLVPASGFTQNTTPSLGMVEQYCMWISSQVDIQLQMAGFNLPLAIYEDDSVWPVSQTLWLQLTTALGVSSYAFGHIHKPAPALSASRGGSTGNVFQELFKEELTKIFNGQATTLRFRASCLSGSPAEKAIRQAKGPNLDYIAGKQNPEDFADFITYTSLKHKISELNSWTVENWTDFEAMTYNKIVGYPYYAS